jgi:hypothetical protein
MLVHQMLSLTSSLAYFSACDLSRRRAGIIEDPILKLP